MDMPLTATEIRIEKDIYQVAGLLRSSKAGAERQHVCIVVLARDAHLFGVHAQGCADAAMNRLQKS